MKQNHYKSLHFLPIFNWSMLHKTQDLRWLLYDFNSKYVPIDLQRTYKSLIEEFGDLKLPLLKVKSEVASKIIDLVLDIVNNSKDVKKLEKATIILSALLVSDDPDIDWLYKVDFTETKKQKGLLTKLVVKIKEFEAKKKLIEDRPEQTLEDKASNMSEILGFFIDIKTNSVLQFMAHEKTTMNKLKQMSK